MENPIKTFWSGITIVALAGLLISNRVLQKENKTLEKRLQIQYSQKDPNQKVKFELYDDPNHLNIIVGYTDPNKQRIYFGQDRDSDGFLDICYIENPFCKDKFRVSEIDYGKNHIPSD